MYPRDRESRPEPGSPGPGMIYGRRPSGSRTTLRASCLTLQEGEDSGWYRPELE